MSHWFNDFFPLSKLRNFFLHLWSLMSLLIMSVYMNRDFTNPSLPSEQKGRSSQVCLFSTPIREICMIAPLCISRCIIFFCSSSLVMVMQEVCMPFKLLDPGQVLNSPVAWLSILFDLLQLCSNLLLFFCSFFLPFSSQLDFHRWVLLWSCYKPFLRCQS